MVLYNIHIIIIIIIIIIITFFSHRQSSVLAIQDGPRFIIYGNINAGPFFP